MNRNENNKCWICQNNVANSREHIIKKTDLEQIYGKLNQSDPVYAQKDGKKIRSIGSTKSDLFKYKKLICEDCNNNKTQQYDKSWATLSKFLYIHKDRIKKDGGINLNEVFSCNIKQKMIDVQLFFIKLFGCKIVESGEIFYLEDLAEAIMSGDEHPNVYISFRDSHKTNYTASSNIECSRDDEDNIDYLHWFYTIGSFSVDVIYSKDISDIDLNGAKKPSEMSTFIALSELTYNQNY